MLSKKLLPSRRAQLTLLVLSLWPWLGHHRSIINSAKLFLNQNSSSSIPLPALIEYQAPLVVASLCLIPLILPQTARQVFVTLIPASAFLLTYYVTFSRVYEYVPQFHYDNVPNIWLFIWLSGATLFFAIWAFATKLKGVGLIKI